MELPKTIGEYKHRFCNLYKYGFYLALLLVGFVLSVYGDQENQAMITSLGGILLGVSISSFFTKLADAEIIYEFGLLSHPKLTSDENLIEKYKLRDKPIHMFYINKLNDGYKWLHIPCDFSKVSIPGYLNINENNELPNGDKYSFNIEAGVREETLISIHTIDQKELLIRVFPDIKYDNSMSKIYCGFVIFTTLDTKGTRLIAPTILTREQDRFGKVEKGEIKNPEQVKEMNRLWCEAIEKLQFEFLVTRSELQKIEKEFIQK